MRGKLIGRKYFEGLVDITDPCYNKNVWCRMNATVKAGVYDCRIYRHTQKIQYDGKAHIYSKVGTIGIYLNGMIPNQKEMEEIGSIGVDAGMAGFFLNKPDYTEEEWDDICEATRIGDAWIRDEGFFSSSGEGDGCYGVYADKNDDNEIVALEIRFL